MQNAPRKNEFLRKGLALVTIAAFTVVAFGRQEQMPAQQPPQVNSTTPIVTINVTDRAGKPIADAEAYVLHNTYNLPVSQRGGIRQGDLDTATLDRRAIERAGLIADPSEINVEQEIDKMQTK